MKTLTLEGAARVMLAVCTLLCAGIALTGCSASTPETKETTGGGVLTGSQLASVYESKAQNFELSLPEGYAIPKKAPSSVTSNSGGKGVAFAAIYFYWLCAWENTYLSSFNSGGASAAEPALTEIKKWPTTEFATKYWSDPDGEWTKNVVTPATLGDPAGIRQDFEGETCESILHAS